MAAQLWFISDTHFGHENIIRYANRPFSNAGEMDAAMIERWNEVVKPQDHVYHLGDVTMWRSSDQIARLEGIIKSLNGHKRLILGNHDHYHVKDYLRVGFEKVMAMNVFNKMLFTHVPIHPKSMGRSAANVHGHIHDADAYPPVQRVAYQDNWEGKPPVELGLSPYINISVEAINYTPISLEMIEFLVRKAA